MALAAAACLPEGPVVPMSGAGFTVFYQPVGPSSWFFNKSLNQRLYKLTRLAVKDLID